MTKGIQINSVTNHNNNKLAFLLQCFTHEMLVNKSSELLKDDIWVFSTILKNMNTIEIYDRIKYF